MHGTATRFLPFSGLCMTPPTRASWLDQIVEAAVADDALRQAAAVNPGDKFELVFKNLLENLFVERMDQNEEIFVRFMNDASFQKIVTTWMASEAYRRLRRSDDTGGSAERTRNSARCRPACGSSSPSRRNAT